MYAILPAVKILIFLNFAQKVKVFFCFFVLILKANLFFMKRTIMSIVTISLLCLNAQAQIGPDITAWLQNTTATGYGGYVSNVQLVQYSANYVYVSANCIPEYSIGPWPTDPNVPSPQNFVCEFPRYPSQNMGTPTNVSLGSIGLWTNGVGIFNSEDGFHWNSATSSWAMGPGTSWNRNALIFEGASFDTCLGHPAPGGEYHNHVNPKCLYNDRDSSAHSPIIGFAFDGFPIYGAYGYVSTTSASGPVRRMRSSYQLTTDTIRSGGPHPLSTYPLGDCVDDYIYTAGSGDLDEHNGRFCYTTDYPGGTYAYFVTIDSNLSPVYPFVIGPTYYGVVGSTNPHVTPTGTDTTYTVPTAIRNTEAGTIKYIVAPNPVEDHIYLYLDAGNENNITGYLYSNDGQILKEIRNLQPSIAYAIDVTNLKAGDYLLVFQGASGRVSEKIVIVK